MNGNYRDFRSVDTYGVERQGKDAGGALPTSVILYFF